MYVGGFCIFSALLFSLCYLVLSQTNPFTKNTRAYICENTVGGTVRTTGYECTYKNHSLLYGLVTPPLVNLEAMGRWCSLNC